MSTTNDERSEAEKTLQGELDAAHQERVSIEDAFREGMQGVEVKIRNLIARLNLSRSERIKAAATAAAAKQDVKPTDAEHAAHA